MKKAAALTVTLAMAAATLAGCGGDSEYCAAVKQNVSALDSFGKKKTDAGFKKYRQTANAISKVAPSPVDKDWKALTKAMVEVRDAQKAAGLKLEDVTVDSVAGLSTAQSSGLNSAYQSFTDATATYGSAIKKDVKKQCGVTLK